MTRLLALLPLLACSRTTAPGFDGGGGSTGLPPTITISGTVAVYDSTQPAQGEITVAANRLDDDSLVASTFTNAGAFSLTIPTSTPDFNDIYLVATAASYVPSYYNFQQELFGSAYASIDLFTPTAFDGLFTATATTKTANASVIEAYAESYDGLPIAGAQFQVGTGTVIYDASTGHPDTHVTSTSGDGRGYILNAVAGSIEMSSVDPPSSSREIRVYPTAVSEIELHTPPGAD
ncbi:MAG TPA: hypothetical protein VMJ10_17490 [Kofleriaceae bacterium]|nr:hypothetical protein [Kofleriaceae bacterium]